MTLKDIWEGNTASKRVTWKNTYAEVNLCQFMGQQLLVGQMVKGSKFEEQKTRKMRNKYKARTISEWAQGMKIFVFMWMFTKGFPVKEYLINQVD